METKHYEEWIVLSDNETTRTYVFPGGETYTIDRPQKIFIKKSGSHKIVDMYDKCHYIPPKWIAFNFEGYYHFNVEKAEEE